MSDDLSFPLLAIDPDTFAHHLASGALDACLYYLRHEQSGGRDSAELNCRLGEALFHRGRGEEALECGRRAYAIGGSDDHIAHFCAWLFSNCGDHRQAAAAYQRLIERDPDWVEGYRHASGSLAAIGALDRAIALGARASDQAPEHGEFALHAGSLLLAAGRADDAAWYLRRAASLEPGNPHALRELSAARAAQGRLDEAVALAVRAAGLSPQDADFAIHAAELMLRDDRVAEAVAILEAAARQAPGNARLWRVLSGAEDRRERARAALAAIDRALALSPGEAEYHVHRAHLLYGLGEFTAAAAAFTRAAAIDPESPTGQRARLGALAAGGHLTEATAIGGELLRAFPEDTASAEAVLQVLNRRLDTIDGEFVILGERAGRRPRRPRPPAGFAERLRRQARVIHALIIRETRTRFGESRLGYGWALLEPVLHIAMLSAVFSLLMRGRPPIGTQFFIFYYTGLIPYHAFVHTSTGMTHAITSNGSLLQLPLVTNVDAIVARGLLEFATDLVVAVLLLAGFAAAGMPALPDDIGAAIAALTAVALLGCGVGFINAVLQVLFKSWDKLWTNATRLLYFFSGIFYVPGIMPDWARDLLAWNPVLQAVEWFRAGFFSAYRPHWLDRSYLVILALTTLAVGLALERGLRRRLREPS